MSDFTEPEYVCGYACSSKGHDGGCQRPVVREDDRCWLHPRTIDEALEGQV